MRRTALLLVLIASTQVISQTRVRPSTPLRPEPGETVSGTVSSVSGPLVRLADGLVTIDTTNANIAGEIVPGVLLFAVIDASVVAPDLPLRASFVGVTRTTQVTLTGPVTAVDPANSSLTLLGRTIRIDPSIHLIPGQLVSVEANASANGLLAAKVNVLKETPVNQIHLTGLVKSIEPTMWTVGGPPGSLAPDHLIRVTEETKIVGDPKVDDRVEIVAVVNEHGPITAISITKLNS